MTSSWTLPSHPQIIQTEGSYSFLLCGVIIACLGFVFFIGLLLFQRMHRNYLLGAVSTHTFKRPHALLLSVLFHSFPPPATQQEHRKSPRWWRNRRQPSRTDRPKQKRKRRKRAAERRTCFHPSCGTWSITAIWPQILHMIYLSLQNVHFMCWYTSIDLGITWYFPSRLFATVRGYISNS